MKITLDIPDGMIAGFFNGVNRTTDRGLCLVSYQLDSSDLFDGNELKLPRDFRQKDGDGNA